LPVPSGSAQVVAEQRGERGVGLGVDHRVDPLLGDPVAVVVADRLLEHHVVARQRDLVDLERHVEAVVGQLAEADQAIDLAEQLAVDQRALVEVVIGVDLEAAVLGEALGGHARGHQHDRDVAQRALLAALEHLEPGLVRLLDGDHHQRRRLARGQRDRAIDIGLGRDVEPVAAQLVGERGSKRGIGVDQQDAAVHRPR
jgi:hypothetical protein